MNIFTKKAPNIMQGSHFLDSLQVSNEHLEHLFTKILFDLLKFEKFYLPRQSLN